MGQQQLLLLILGVIVVAIAVAVGISQFAAQSAQANKDGVIAGLVNLSAHAYQYRMKPANLGGGGNSYTGYAIPASMQADDNAGYSLSGAPSATQVVFVATSKMNGAWSVTCTVDSLGRNSLSISGW